MIGYGAATMAAYMRLARQEKVEERSTFHLVVLNIIAPVVPATGQRTMMRLNLNRSE